MGLDNGLIIKGKNKKARDFLKENFSHLSLEKYGLSGYEFHYSRKCWNIRKKFLEEFSDKGYDGQGGAFCLKKKDLYRVVDVLKYFLNEENWGDESYSIWEWSEALPWIAKNISDIIYFLQKIEEENYQIENKSDKLKNKDFKIYYYDSY